MNFKLNSLLTLGLAAGLAIGLMHVPASAQAPEGKQDGKAKGKGGGFIRSNDPRVQNRTYHFADTNEDLPYCSDHGGVIEQGMPDIFAFFKAHTRQ